MAKLFTVLKASTKQIRKIIKKDLLAAGYEPVVEDEFIYAKGDIPVLLLAHYDTVFNRPPKYIRNIDGVLSSETGLGADDRAGVYGVLEIIKTHKCHVLFTDGEERGCIGSEAFTRSGIMPEVNYCIELDRRGVNDAVYYEGANEDFEAYVTKHGWKTNWGSFTDICVIAPYLNVSAVNLSIGYQNEHSAKETLDTKVMNANIERARAMLDGEKFEWVEQKYYGRYFYGDYGYYGGYSSYGGDTWYGDKRYRQKGYAAYEDEEWEDWLVVGETADHEEFAYFSIGRTYEEALGTCMMEHPDLCYNDVYDVYINRPEVPAASDDKETAVAVN